MISISAVGWTGVARLVRGQVLSLRERDYVLAALAAGATRFRLMSVHVLGALKPFLLLQLGLHLPYFLLGEVLLSFLGSDDSTGDCRGAHVSAASMEKTRARRQGEGVVNTLATAALGPDDGETRG